MVDEKVVKTDDSDKLTAKERENLRNMLRERQKPLKLINVKSA